MYQAGKKLKGNNEVSLEELAKLEHDDESSTLPDSNDLQVNENRKKVANSLRLDVKNINIEIPQDVHFQNEEQVLELIP